MYKDQCLSRVYEAADAALILSERQTVEIQRINAVQKSHAGLRKQSFAAHLRRALGAGRDASKFMKERTSLPGQLSGQRRRGVSSTSLSSPGPLELTTAPEPGQVQVWKSSADLSTHLQRQDDLRLSAISGQTGPVVEVDVNQKMQPVEGFGASITESSAFLINQKMTEAQIQALMVGLFDPSHGIGLSMIRQPMGATDFTHVGSYTYDDGAPDPGLERFSVARDEADIVPLLRMAKTINKELKIIAVPWSPPAWMKSNNSLAGGTLKANALASLAQYFVRFVQSYGALGVPIWAVAPQNEPQFGGGGYPSMLMNAKQQKQFIGSHLGPALQGASLPTKILGYDHNACEEGGGPCPAAYPASLLADADTARYLHGIAWHCYNGDLTYITTFHDAHPDVPMYMTECSGGCWQNGNPSYLHDALWLTFRSLNNWMRSVITWNLALDPGGGPTNGGSTECRGVVTIDPSTGAAKCNAEFYSLGHLSKFWRPGARVIAATASGIAANLVAYCNTDGSNVLLMENPGCESMAYWVRSGSQAFQASLEAGAVVTYIWQQPGEQQRSVALS